MSEHEVRVAAGALLVAALVVGTPLRAQAQALNDCQPSQYLDRTAPNADRELTWDMSIATDPERCLEVRVGQTVVWNGDFDMHPLGTLGGDTPNPIFFHQNGAVTFSAPGTFGYHCLSHSSMLGAVRVVPAPPAPAPALSPWLAAVMAGLLLGSGCLLFRRGRQATAGS